MVRDLSIPAAMAAMVMAFGFARSARADPYADSVAGFDPVTSGISATGDTLSTSVDADEPAEGGTDALGAPDAGTWAQSVALGLDQKGTPTTEDDDRGTIVLDFTDNVCVGISGGDIRVWEVADNENYLLEIALNGGAFSPPTTGFGTDNVDLLDVLDGEVFNRVRITAINAVGNLNFAGADIDAVKCLASIGADDLTATNTGPTSFDFAANGPQHFDYEITITNNTASDGALNDLVAFDVIRADFRLDPAGEDFADDGDATNNSCADAGGCDGIAEDMFCPVTVPPRATASGLEPQPFTIGIDLAANAACTTTVFVAYESAAGSHKKSAGRSKPKDCDLVVDGNPGVFDTIALNDGIKVFDTFSGELLFGPKDSIQLAGVNCG